MVLGGGQFIMSEVPLSVKQYLIRGAAQIFKGGMDPTVPRTHSYLIHDTVFDPWCGAEIQESGGSVPRLATRQGLSQLSPPYLIRGAAQIFKGVVDLFDERYSAMPPGARPTVICGYPSSRPLMA